MLNAPTDPPRYAMLRRLFVLGYAMNIILWFVPTMRMKVGGILGVGAQEDVYSVLTLVQRISQTSPGWHLFFVLTFASNILFIVLAVAYARRWIFITGASVATLFLLWGLFSTDAPGVEGFLLPRILGYVATALTLTGFVVVPSSRSRAVPGLAGGGGAG